MKNQQEKLKLSQSLFTWQQFLLGLFLFWIVFTAWMKMWKIKTMHYNTANKVGHIGDTQKENQKEGVDYLNAIEWFYASLSNTDGSVEEIEDVMKGVIADGWTSNGEAETPLEFAESVKGYHWLIPDLEWRVVDTYIDDDRVVIRGNATWTPNGDFFGVSTNGTKTFDIMSIDIHTINDGKITQSYHVEEWLQAVGQVSAND